MGESYYIQLAPGRPVRMGGARWQAFIRIAADNLGRLKDEIYRVSSS